jgi:hypothetical protein
MLGRILRDPAMRALPLWIAMAALCTSALAGFIRLGAVKSGSPMSYWSLLLACWCGIAVYLGCGKLRVRCSSFDMTLPVPARRQWISHLLAVLLAGGLISAASLTVVFLHLLLPSRGVPVEINFPVLATILAAGLILAVLLLQAPRPALACIPITRGYVLWVIAVLAGVAVLLALAGSAAPFGAIGLLLAAAVLGWWLYRRVPPSFVLAPREPDASAPAVGDYSGHSFPALPIVLLRGTTAGVKEIFFLPFTLLCGFILGGGFEIITDEPYWRNIRFMWIPMVAYMLFAFMGPKLGSLHHLDPLPVSRRLLFAALVLPYMLMFCISYGAGVAASVGPLSRTELVDYREWEAGFDITPPLRVYEIARDGNPPETGSPWGESQPPSPSQPFSFSRAVIYSPYSAPAGSSDRFVALQISRAVQAVYGATIAPEEIAERYLTPSRGEGLTLRQDYPGLRARSGPVFPFLLALSAVPWLLMTAALLRAYRAGIREWVRQTVVWASLSVMMLLWLAEVACMVTGFIQPWVYRGLVEIPAMRLGASIPGTLAVWAVTMLLVALSYLIAQSQFLRMEIPTKPSKYTLVDYMREGN